MTTYLGKSCSFGLPRVPLVNCRQFMYLVISLLVLRAGCGIWLYQFLIIAYLFTLLVIIFEIFYDFPEFIRIIFFSISNNDCNVLALCCLSFFLNNFYIVSLGNRNALEILYHFDCERPFVPSHVKNTWVCCNLCRTIFVAFSRTFLFAYDSFTES